MNYSPENTRWNNNLLHIKHTHTHTVSPSRATWVHGTAIWYVHFFSPQRNLIFAFLYVICLLTIINNKFFPIFIKAAIKIFLTYLMRQNAYTTRSEILRAYSPSPWWTPPMIRRKKLRLFTNQNCRDMWPSITTVLPSQSYDICELTAQRHCQRWTYY